MSTFNQLVGEKHLLRLLLVVIGIAFYIQQWESETSSLGQRSLDSSVQTVDLEKKHLMHQVVAFQKNTSDLIKEIKTMEQKQQRNMNLATKKETKRVQELEVLRHNNSDLEEEVALLRSHLKKKQKEHELLSQKVQTNSTHDAPNLPNTPLTHPQWCPGARCQNSALCKPCQRRFLIVITSPRSASTTLTWMLDALPGVTMGGENNNALGRIKAMQEGILNHKSPIYAGKNNNNAGKQHSAWYHHKFVDQSFGCVAQDMIRFLNPPILDEHSQEFIDPEMEATEIVGFKTIRLFDGMPRNKEKSMAKWLIRSFPCARYIINVNSDLDGMAKSLKKAFGRSNKEKSLEEIKEESKKTMQQLLRFYTLLGEDRAYLMDKAKWTSGDMTVINEAVQWLGFDESCQFEELLEYNTVDKYKAGNNTQVKPWPSSCKAL